MAEDRPLIALTRIVDGNNEYNWGDEVPDSVAKKNLNAVGPKPLTQKEIDSMTKDQLKEALATGAAGPASPLSSKPEGDDE